MAEFELLSRPLESQARLPALQLRGKGGILGAGVGNVRDGRNRNHAVGQSQRRKSSAPLVAGCGYGHPLLRSDIGHAPILVWHFYQVFLDPDVYPMNWAWWDGKMTLHHYREEHGLDDNPLIVTDDSEAAESSEASAESSVTPHEESEPAEVKHGQ